MIVIYGACMSVIFYYRHLYHGRQLSYLQLFSYCSTCTSTTCMFSLQVHVTGKFCCFCLLQSLYTKGTQNLRIPWQIFYNGLDCKSNLCLYTDDVHLSVFLPVYQIVALGQHRLDEIHLLKVVSPSNYIDTCDNMNIFQARP